MERPSVLFRISSVIFRCQKYVRKGYMEMTKKIYLETLKNALGRFILQYYIVSTLCEVENPKSDFVSFSTSDQRSTTLKQR